MTQQTRVRRVAALAAGALASTTLMFVAAPAQAADPTPAAGAKLTWSFSSYLATMFTGHAATGGAAISGADVVFGGGKGSSSVSSGTFDMQYQGSAAFEWHGVTLTFSAPEVVVAAGEGKLEADVAWAIPAQGESAAVNGSAADVVLTTFAASGATWNASSIAATPRWAGVLPPNTPASAAAGMATDKPVNGEAWAPGFLTALPASARGYFYSSGSNAVSDAKKAPAAFVAQSVAPAVTATATPSKQSVSIKVDGTDFTGTDGKPGDNGVYVGLAPAGGLPATSSQADMDKFAASAWVPATGIVNGVISTTLTASADKLDKGTAYAVYTWRAHSHSTASQDTQTAVALDWSTISAASKVTAKVAKKPTTKKPGKLKVAVNGGTLKAAGTVKVTLKKGKVTKTKNATLTKAAATVALPKLKAGKWKVTVAYTSGDAAYVNGKKVLTLKVAGPKSKKK